MEEIQQILSPCSSLGSSSSLPKPKTLSIDAELWLMAEQRTQEILWTIQPNVASECNRIVAIDYIQRLFKGYLGIEVVAFGSVPLRAYLPDGDIDMTVLCHQNEEEDIARAVCSILEVETKNSRYQVEDVRYVYAKVKIIKLTVNNIAVDISFNQMAGICTLCFLEQVDQLIGRDHLFKQSIILIKAWCYYESRILGSPHGLISTYALETLVLHIINLFHSSLRGPLEVLHRFLEYYSTFDWDNYYITIYGPVAISSLPEIIETPEHEGEELLFGKEFLKNSRDIFSGSEKVDEATVNEFPIKHLNIMDPLKDNNNLGRSVSKGNFYRIRSAFSLGAQKLGEILMLPGESIPQKLEKFFGTIIDRNGRGQRADVEAPVPAFGTGTSKESNLYGDYDTYYDGLLFGWSFYDPSLHLSTQPSPPPYQVWNQTTWNALTRSMELNWNVFCQSATNAYPRLPFGYPNASQPFAATLAVGKVKKSQGTGTFIPNVAHTSNYSRYMHSTVSESIPESGSHSVMKKSPQKSDQVGTFSKTDTGGNVGCFDLSLEEFPHLSGIRTPPLPKVQSYEPVLKSLQAEDSSGTSRDIKFGNLEHSSSVSTMPSPAASKQADTRVSYTRGIMPGVPKMRMQKKQESSEIGEVTILMERYQLDNDKDFPPL